MVFAGAFLGNNKTSAPPAPPQPPAPPRFRFFFEVYSVGPEGFAGSIDAFESSARDVPADQGPVLVREDVEEGAESEARGSGFNVLGSPEMFEVVGAELSNLEVNGNEWSAMLRNVTGDITFRMPVGMMEGGPPRPP